MQEGGEHKTWELFLESRCARQEPPFLRLYTHMAPKAVKLFFWPHLWHIEVPRPGIKSEPQLQPMLQLQQCRFLTHYAMSGFKPMLWQKRQILNPLQGKGFIFWRSCCDQQCCNFRGCKGRTPPGMWGLKP